MRLNVHAVESAPFAENSYVVWADGTTQAVVVDPGFDPDAIVNLVTRKGLTVAAILNTHGHVDHIAGNGAMKEAYPAAPLVIGRGDAPMLLDPMMNLSGMWGFHIVSPPADQLVDDGERLTVAGIEWEVREIPGHSPGHVVFVAEGISVSEKTRGSGISTVTDTDTDTFPLVLGGDVLFAGGVGRTDFPGGSFPQLAAGIRAKLWPLPDAAKVFPGHGPPTTIGQEKRTNPYVGERV